MAEFTVTADKYHVHVTDGHRTEEYDIEVATPEEAREEAKRRWALRGVVPSVADLPLAPVPEPEPEPAPPAPLSELAAAEDRINAEHEQAEHEAEFHEGGDHAA